MHLLERMNICSRFLKEHAQSTRISIGHSHFGHRGAYDVLDGGTPYGNRSDAMETPGREVTRKGWVAEGTLG